MEVKQSLWEEESGRIRHNEVDIQGRMTLLLLLDGAEREKGAGRAGCEALTGSSLGICGFILSLDELLLLECARSTKAKAGGPLCLKCATPSEYCLLGDRVNGCGR